MENEITLDSEDGTVYDADNGFSLTISHQGSRKLVKFLVIRCAGFIGLLLAGVIFAIIVVEALPGDPWTLLLRDSNIGPSRGFWVFIESQKLKWGFDEPFVIRVCKAIRNILTGDWGLSMTVQKATPVLDVIRPRTLRTVEILLFSLLLALPVSVGLGVLSGRKKGTRTDRLILGFAGVCFIIPLSAFGIVLQYIFAVKWDLLPPAFYQNPEYISWIPDITGFRLLDSLLKGEMVIFLDTLKHLLLPASILAIGLTAVLVISIRKITILKKSKNLHHPTRNYIRTFLVFLYMSVITILIETTFQLNGSGMLTIAAIVQQDFFLILALVIRNVFFFQLTAFIVDIIGGFIHWKMETKHFSSSTDSISVSDYDHSIYLDSPESKGFNEPPLTNSKIDEEHKPLVSWSWKSMLLRPGVLIGAFILLICYVMVLCAPILFEYSDLVLIDENAIGWTAPDNTHLLGTGKFGRDVFGRVLWGARVPIEILFPLSLVLGILGYLLGFLCIGKIPFLDIVVNFIMKLFLLIPGISIFILYLSIIDPTTTIIIPLIGGFVFLTSMMLGHRAIDEHHRYSTSGHRKGQILKSYIPQIFAFSLILSVLAESLLFATEFLGFGDPTIVSWGSDINYARGRIYESPWAAGWPLLACYILLLGIGSIGFSTYAYLKEISSSRISFPEEPIIDLPID